MIMYCTLLVGCMHAYMFLWVGMSMREKKKDGKMGRKKESIGVLEWVGGVGWGAGGVLLVSGLRWWCVYKGGGGRGEERYILACECVSVGAMSGMRMIWV